MMIKDSKYNLYEIFLDDEDFERLKFYKWCINVKGYVVASSKTGVVYLHQRVMGGVKPGLCIDHINQNKLDNRRQNLRFVSKSRNNLNSSSREHAFRNITPRYGKFQVRIIRKHNILVFSKVFETLIEAQTARDNWLVLNEEK